MSMSPVSERSLPLLSHDHMVLPKLPPSAEVQSVPRSASLLPSTAPAAAPTKAVKAKGPCSYDDFEELIKRLDHAVPCSRNQFSAKLLKEAVDRDFFVRFDEKEDLVEDFAVNGGRWPETMLQVAIGITGLALMVFSGVLADKFHCNAGVFAFSGLGGYSINILNMLSSIAREGHLSV